MPDDQRVCHELTGRSVQRRRCETQGVATADFVDSIQRSLSPLMTARGFGPSGPGWSPGGSASFLFCIGAREFAVRHPSTFELLRTLTDVSLDEPSWCLDFVVGISSSGEIERLDFECVDLNSLLRAAEVDDLAHRCDIEQLRRARPDQVVATIVEAVDVLLPVESEQ